MLLFPLSNAGELSKNLAVNADDNKPQYFVCKESKDLDCKYRLFGTLMNVICGCGRKMKIKLPNDVGSVDDGVLIC